MIDIYESTTNTKWNGTTTTSTSTPNLDDALENASPEDPGSSKSYDNEANKGGKKVERRLAQNREAARKSRLRKKAYVQQLESSKIKLAQIEQEVQHARQQGVYISGHLAESSDANSSGIAAFEIEHTHWVEEQIKRTSELRSALQARVSDIELRMLVEGMISHYDNLFQIKAIITKSDVFYLMSGKWKTQAERFFLWIGGSRPSEILKILIPQLEPLTGKQEDDVNNLQQMCYDAENELTAGMDNLLQVVSQKLTSHPMGDASRGGASQSEEMADAVCKLESLIKFVIQADELRRQTIQQMQKILTVRQAARGLLSLADFFQRLRALSSLWAARPRESS